MPCEPGIQTSPADVAAVRAVARLARFTERSLGDLSLAQYRVLSAVASGEARASRVARRLALGKPAVSAAVEALSRRGLLSQSAASTDQRVVALALTADGVRVVAAAEAALARRLRGLCVDAAEADALVAVLARLGTALEVEASERAAGSRG